MSKPEKLIDDLAVIRDLGPDRLNTVIARLDQMNPLRDSELWPVAV